jgi:hypothetical protein
LKLNELTKAKVISFWCFIPHKPEDDEAGKKNHIHLYIEPSKMLQTDDLKEALKEYDPSNPSKPLGVIKWVYSKFADWYLYAIHDKRYLAMKGQARLFHYLDSDISSSDDDELLSMIRSIDLVSLSPYADMDNAIQSGVSWFEYFNRGTVPIPQITQFQKAFELIALNHTHRNGRISHSPKVDEATGEVLENEHDD